MKFNVVSIITIVIPPFLEHLLVGDEIATTETLLTVGCLHACHASTRAPESESDNKKKADDMDENEDCK